MTFRSTLLTRPFLTLVALGLAWPVLAILGTWLGVDSEGADILWAMAATVLRIRLDQCPALSGGGAWGRGAGHSKRRGRDFV